MIIFSAGNILLIGAILLFISIVLSKVSNRFGIPTLLVFLFVGMLFGSDGLGIQFNNAGQAQFIGMIALSIILFTGGMETKYSDIKPVLGPGIVLSTLGVALTALFTGIFIYYMARLLGQSEINSFLLALLLASTMSSTDSASVFSLLRSQSIGLKNNLKPMLELESGSNDPMAYMLTVVLISVINAETVMSGWSVALQFTIQFALGALAGWGLGKIAVFIINKINLSNTSLYPILLLAFILFTFSFTDALGGNGYLAVYLAGVIVGNNPLVSKRETMTFLDGMTWLFQIIMFISLGLLVNPKEMISIAPFALLIGVFMILIGRPLSVFISLIPFKKINSKSKLFVSWVGLRGAVPIIFATYPVVANVEGAHQIFNIVFFITILSLVIQGMTITSVAKKLKLDTKLEKEGNDFGIIFPEEIDSKLWDVDVTENMLVNGNTLANMKLPKGILVILIKRGNDYIIPNGSVEIEISDKLLLISPPDQDEEHILQP